MAANHSSHPDRTQGSPRLVQRMARWTVLSLACWAAVNAHAQTPTPSPAPAPAAATVNTAGEVEFARGVGFVQSPGQQPKTLGKGMPLKEGDRVTTAEGASAIVRLEDGTRMTVRPNSELVLQQFRFKADAQDNSMVMSLLRGGLRAITGSISKRSATAARIATPTATIGIRGTDFDARLCRSDCSKEAVIVTDKARPNAIQASAKVVQSRGDLNAVDTTGASRRLVDGGSVYPGDTIETGNGAQAVLAFRDESKLTLGSATRFKVENFVYDDQNPREGRMFLSLLRGSARALTGLIAKSNNRNVRVSTPTATIGIRGTGLDAQCDDNGCSFFNWLGAIDLQNAATGELIRSMQAGQGFFVSPTGVQPITVSPITGLPRPDSVPVNQQQLFGSNNVSETQEGLFVYVRDGHIEVKTAGEVLHLGRGETGFAGNTGEIARPQITPRFIDFDKIPLPNSKNPTLGSLLGNTSPSSNTGKVCRG
jgi:hypothetical protein